MGGSDVLKQKGPIEALQEWFGQRVHLRRTYGDAALTRAVLLCNVLEDELGCVGMKALARDLMDGRAGEKGWDTDTSIRAVEASAPKSVKLETGNGHGGKAP